MRRIINPVGKLCVAARAPRSVGTHQRGSAPSRDAKRSRPNDGSTSCDGQKMMAAEGEEGVAGGDPAGDPDNTAVTTQRARHGQSDSIHNSEAPNTPLHGLAVEVVDEMNVDTVDVESWVASLRPSADYLNAGATFVGSDELQAHKKMLRFIGELSASQMLGEKAGARPGADAAIDAAWKYVTENPDRLSSLVVGAAAAAPPERKNDVEHLLTWLVSPLGLHYLRAFACELRRATTASPHAAVTDVAANSSPVNWSACWAWCVQHSTTLSGWNTKFSHRTSVHCVAGTVTLWRRPSARCTWLGVRCSAL